MASYDHWLNDNGIAFAKALHDKPQDIAGHGAFADYLEEHGDPLHAVVRRAPKYANWIVQQTGDPGMYPLGDGSSHEGYIIRSHPEAGLRWGGPRGNEPVVQEAPKENSFYVHHKVIGSKRQPGGRYSLIAASVNFPGAKSGSTKDRARFVAPVTKDELKAILEFHRGRRDYGMVGGVTGNGAARRALRSKAVGEHPITGEDPLTLARGDVHPRIAAEAREYHTLHKDKFGLDLSLDAPGPQFNPELSRRTAAAFEKAKHLPQHPKVKEAYDALKRETKAQYDFIVGKGLKVEPWSGPTSEFTGGDYDNADQVAHDARNNRHLYYFPSDVGFGTDHESHTDHPLYEKVPGMNGERYNDLFRVVHDYFGHAMAGHSFKAPGEFQAWTEHAKMFSPKARLAMTAETHGQNSWVNYGPFGHLPNADKPYAEQKATIMPKNVVPKMEPTKMARGDAFLANTGSDEPDEDAVTPARVLPNTQKVVWRSGPSGHVVGLPMRDGTTLVRRYGSVAEARPEVMAWAKGASQEHRSALLDHLRSLPNPAATRLAPVTPPVAKRVQVARPTVGALLGRPGPTVVQYKPGMEPPVKADREDVSTTPNHPELLRRILAGNLDGAKKFLEDSGDPLAHLLDSRSRYSADSKANLCCGPNTIKTYGHATNHQATVRLLPGGEMEAVFRQIGTEGPKAVGFRKQLDPDAVRAIVAYHRQSQAPRGAVTGEPEKLAGPQLQAANREPIRVKTTGEKAGVPLRLNEGDPVKLTRRRQFQGWWLSPKGKMHRTGYVSHDRYARNKFGKSRDEMHADGWHRVARFGGSRLHVLKGGKGLNEDQRKAVKSHAEKKTLAVGREPEGADVQAARNPVGPSGLAQALKDLQSQRQVVRKQLAARIAQEAGVQLAALLDSASVVPHPRAGIVQQLQHNDRDTLNYAAAWYGMLAREPRLTVFHEGDGNDVLHVTNSPLGVSQILETAGQHRLPGVSVSPKGDIHVVDPGGRNTPGVMRFLQDVRAVRPNTVRGEAHRLGSASGDPSDSRAAYRDVIKNFQGG